MLDTRYDSVVYQSQVYVSALVDELVQAKKKIGKEKDAQWAKVDRIYAYLEALQETSKLTDETDITNITFILECLIVLCEIASFPVVPSLMWTGVPSLIVGAQGPPGTPGIRGATGATGFASDFLGANLTASAVVDFFPITDAKGARWDYVAVDSVTGAQRASSIIGQWTPNGLSLEMTDLGTEDLVSSTAGLEFDLIYSAPNIQLVAVITSGNWTINGTRYYIPSNGSGSGPITNVLPFGQIYIGNNSNQAQAQVLSGVISLSPLGITSYVPGSVTDTTISNSAAITLTKLATLSPDVVVVTDGSGYLTASTLSPTTLSYVDIGSSLVGLLSAKLTDPLTTIGDLLIRDASNITTRLPIGSVDQVLTVIGGVPTWQNTPGGITGLVNTYIPVANSSTTITNSVISQSGGNINIAGGLDVSGNKITSLDYPVNPNDAVRFDQITRNTNTAIVRAFGSSFQPSLTNDCLVSYTFNITTQFSFGFEVTVSLETSPDNFTFTEVGRLGISASSTIGQTGQLNAYVPAGHYVNFSLGTGFGTHTYITGQETTLSNI